MIERLRRACRWRRRPCRCSPPGWGRRLTAAPLLVVIGQFLFTSCSRPPSLANTLASPEAVARAVIAALAARDGHALDALAVSEAEFRDLVWPKLPASRPERHMPWTYVWESLHGKSVLYARARLTDWTDPGFDVVRVHGAGETTDYGTHRIHRQTVVTLHDRSGVETELRLFGSMIEQDGRYKVFSYVVD